MTGSDIQEPVQKSATHAAGAVGHRPGQRGSAPRWIRLGATRALCTRWPRRLGLRRCEVVHRKLLDVWRARERLVAKLLGGWLQPPLGEPVESLARLPEVDNSPAPVDRARRVEDHARGWVALNIHVPVNRVVLLLRRAAELEPQSDCHFESSPRCLCASITPAGEPS